MTPATSQSKPAQLQAQSTAITGIQRSYFLFVLVIKRLFSIHASKQKIGVALPFLPMSGMI